jgi:hypothetical protein
MKNPSPGSCFGGLGRLREGTVLTGAALTATMCRTPVVFIAATMARALESDSGVGIGVRAEAGYYGVGSGDRGLQRCLIGCGQVDGDGAHRTGQLGRVADHGGDVVSRCDGLLKQFPSDSSGGRDDREFHDSSVVVNGVGLTMG